MKRRAARCGTRVHEITVEVGDGAYGRPGSAPFDRVIATAAARRGAAAQTRPGGRVLVPWTTDFHDGARVVPGVGGRNHAPLRAQRGKRASLDRHVHGLADARRSSTETHPYSVLGCRDPEVLARFWCEVLDFVVLDREEDCIEIGPREGFGGPQPTIILSRRDEPEPGKPRLHIDVNATDRDQDAELERLLKLGARPADIGQTGEESWHVLADPEGNEFCLLRARIAHLGQG